jgi:hypothetical protein
VTIATQSSNSPSLTTQIAVFPVNEKGRHGSYAANKFWNRDPLIESTHVGIQNPAWAGIGLQMFEIPDSREAEIGMKAGFEPQADPSRGELGPALDAGHDVPYQGLTPFIHLPVLKPVLFLLWFKSLEFYREIIEIYTGSGKSYRNTDTRYNIYKR